MSGNAIKQTDTGLTGNSAVAYALHQINPDVFPAYPITPSTTVMEEFASYVADGKVDTEMITCESEHSAMSACVGAAAAGARVATTTSSQGLALMWEVLYIASGLRLPVLLVVVNRALSAPINIHCDHTDSMGARDSGWIQLYSESVQEAYDNVFQAQRIMEHKDVLVPAMVCLDGFITSHGIENLTLLSKEDVQNFIGEWNADRALLNPGQVVTMGATSLQDTYMEFKHEQSKAIARAKQVVIDVGKEYGELTGRSYGLMEEYRLDDAEYAIVSLNSAAGTNKVAIDRLRNEGKKVGLLKPRLFRPFPHQEIAAALEGKKAVAVLDRADSMNGFGAPLFTDIRSALYDSPDKPKMFNRIFGLGGRDYKLDDALGVFDELFKVGDTGEIEELVKYITI